MSYISEAVINSDSNESLSGRVLAILHHQSEETAKLQAQVDSARERINGANAPGIRSLLDGLSGELQLCYALIQKRIASVQPTSAQHVPLRLENGAYWQLYRIDGSHCPSHLEALLSGYARYARTTSESIGLLARLGDRASEAALNNVAAAADNALWLIELYMEGLALHQDLGHLPEFSPTIGIFVSHKGD